jgi:hypothetical protein
MNEHVPDRWVVLKIVNEFDTFYKVFATWFGGYLDGDSWRANSGITKIEEDGDYWLFYGNSGSVYRCHKEGFGTSGYTYRILTSFMKQAADSGQSIDIVENISGTLL